MSSEAEREYALLVAQFMGRPGVEHGGKGFGSTALKVNGRIFAMLSHRDRFVLKLPRARVEALTASGDGQAFAPARRVMKEWIELDPESRQNWTKLADEAYSFVAIR